ncbi:MAG: nucleotidyltransferase, partial [Alkalispirochaeta sp.]
LKPDGDGVVSLNDDDSVRGRFSGDEATSMNLFGFTPAAMGRFRTEFAGFLERFGRELKSEFYIPYAMNRLKEAGRARMKVLRSDSEWFGVTYQEDRPDVVGRIQRLVDAGDYPRSLWG